MKTKLMFGAVALINLAGCMEMEAPVETGRPAVGSEYDLTAFGGAKAGGKPRWGSEPRVRMDPLQGPDILVLQPRDRRLRADHDL
ncbi:MAG: hypothetical protein R3D59_01645 [Paracoccaceae bacterium]